MFLVDGYNTVRRLPALARVEQQGGLEAGREALVSAIVAGGVLGSHRVVVVFDGVRGGLPTTPSPHPRLAIRYAAAPTTADEMIVELVTSAKRREAVVVVTADADLGWRVKELGAEVVAPESWEALRAPKPVKRRRPPPGARRSEKPAASRAEVEYWLGVFGEGGERGEDEG